ncbi:hypothetical protein OAS48_00735 [Gammaproteobacteria bacterium]|nr:hypothetical protein [Gammaproteobacteria bacterium]
MKNLFYLSGAITFALISFHFATIQMKSNSKTCKYLAEQIDAYITLSEASDGMKDSQQEVKVAVAKRAKRNSEIYNDYCKF